MYSIKNNIENTLIIKKSKFITKLYRINNVDDINNILNVLKLDYKDSTHICYAYIIGNKERFFDDGEPSGTGGMPILNVLKKNNLNFILAVVIRYFGGIKLGAGGLIRAYTSNIVEALNLTNIVELVEKYLIEIKFDYRDIKTIDCLIFDKIILNKIYSDNIIYEFCLSENELNLIPKLKKITINVFIKDKILIPKD